MKIIGRFFLGLTLAIASQAHAVRSVIWDKTAIRVNLIVGVEQMIHFPSDGQVGLPGNLADADVFQTLFTGETAYWTAHQPFNSERIKVRLDSGEFMLFDVSATVEKSPPKMSEALNVVRAVASGIDRDDGISTKSSATIFDVIRYAAQVIYSPSRLVEPLNGVREVPLGIKGNVNELYDHQDHLGLIFAVNKSWTVDGIFVTAISVLNKHTHTVALDNRLVRHTKDASIHGVETHFIAASFFKQHLEVGGQLGDRTTLFIVTDKPFQSAIRI